MLDWLAHRTQVSPEKVALVYKQQQWTYEALNQLVAQMSSRLAATGIGPGQHVAVLLPNRPEFVCLIHGLARLGAVAVPLNIRLTPEELRWQIHHSDCELLVCSGETEAKVGRLPRDGVQVFSIDSPQSVGIKLLHLVGVEVTEQWQTGSLNLNAVQSIVYTSGTTGQPKGAMLSYANHFWSASASAFRLGVDPADRWLLCMPLYHVGGLAIVLRSCLYGTTVVLQDGFDVKAVREALETQKVTLISVVPTMLHRLLQSHPQTLRDSELRCILIGGDAAPAALIKQCLELDVPIATTYGLTEAASQVATAPFAKVVQKPGTVGKPLMFSSVRIVGENRQPLKSGKVGEIVVSGPTVVQGYYKQPQQTEKALQSGELFTGDMGYLDEEGDLWVVQRRADLIVSGGENVYPAEVEQVLRQHPAVVDVCVVGVEQEEWGQQVAAVVVLNQSADVLPADLLTFSRERLAGYKQPRFILVVDALPRTASGKVRRSIVQQHVSTAYRGESL